MHGGSARASAGSLSSDTTPLITRQAHATRSGRRTHVPLDTRRTGWRGPACSRPSPAALANATSGCFAHSVQVGLHRGRSGLDRADSVRDLPDHACHRLARGTSKREGLRGISAERPPRPPGVFRPGRRPAAAASTCPPAGGHHAALRVTCRNTTLPGAHVGRDPSPVVKLRFVDRQRVAAAPALLQLTVVVPAAVLQAQGRGLRMSDQASPAQTCPDQTRPDQTRPGKVRSSAGCIHAALHS